MNFSTEVNVNSIYIVCQFSEPCLKEIKNASYPCSFYSFYRVELYQDHGLHFQVGFILFLVWLLFLLLLCRSLLKTTTSLEKE